MPSPATHETAHQENAPIQRILLVTGLLGAGKTTALRALEDCGWETIDNFPVRLLESLIDGTTNPHHDKEAPLAIGFDARTRDFKPNRVLQMAKRLSTHKHLEISTLYLDCGTSELERRFNETRRRHPYASDRPIPAGIAAERELLAPLRRWADSVVVTTDMNSNTLQTVIREQYTPASGQPLSLTVSSFGFARGMPPVADFVFDMRFLDNPHWVPHLRALTGQNEAVGNHIQQDPTFQHAFDRILGLILFLLPQYLAQGKSHIHIAFGCTGGKHRSVFTAEQMASALRKAGFCPTLDHRNLSSRATDLVEDKKARL